MYHYKAKIIRVIDGDTCVADVDLGFYCHVILTMRLSGIDAPELKGKTRKAGQAAKDHLYKMIDGMLVEIETAKDPTDKYGRWIVKIELMDGQIVNDLMVEQGHAVYSPGRKRT